MSPEHSTNWYSISQRLTRSNPVPAKQKAVPRKRKLSELSQGDAVEPPAAPAMKKQCGAHAQNTAEGALPAESPDDSRPEPFGEPPAWAEVRLCPSSSSQYSKLMFEQERQALCETFDNYRAYQSGPYHHEGLGYGYLVDQAAAGRIHMDGNIIITRAWVLVNKKTGCNADE